MGLLSSIFVDMLKCVCVELHSGGCVYVYICIIVAMLSCGVV